MPGKSLGLGPDWWYSSAAHVDRAELKTPVKGHEDLDLGRSSLASSSAAMEPSAQMESGRLI
jgi:hypothetical protein